MAAMSRSTARGPQGLRPPLAAAAKTRPYARAALASNGNGSNATSTRRRRSWHRPRSSGHAEACGPAASPASDSADTASSSGRRSTSIRPRSMTTEGLSRPRAPSGTRRGILVDDLIEIGQQLIPLDRRRSSEDFEHLVAPSERSASHRCELADGDASSGHDEGLAGVEAAHDVTAVVAQLALRDGGTHVHIDALVLPNARRHHCNRVTHEETADASAVSSAVFW